MCARRQPCDGNPCALECLRAVQEASVSCDGGQHQCHQWTDPHAVVSGGRSAHPFKRDNRGGGDEHLWVVSDHVSEHGQRFSAVFREHPLGHPGDQSLHLRVHPILCGMRRTIHRAERHRIKAPVTKHRENRGGSTHGMHAWNASRQSAPAPVPRSPFATAPNTFCTFIRFAR